MSASATDEVSRLAINLARNAGYAAFPCAEDKRPTLKGWPERASTDPATIAQLWHEHPGPLIGIVTGSRSGFDVLDIDRKHPEAVIWWQDNHQRLLPTRTFTTRSGGLHLHLLHRDGVTNSQGKICRGIDTRGEGGYAIYWFAAGLPCLDHSPPQPFPDWLFHELTYRPPAPPPPVRTVNPDRAIYGVLRKLAAASEGERNAVLFWCACRLHERGPPLREIEALLLPTAMAIGLTEIEARRTIGSARGRAAA